MTPGQEGVAFRDPGDLANLLIGVANRTSLPDAPLEKSRAWLAAHAPERWDTQWESAARPVLLA